MLDLVLHGDSNDSRRRVAAGLLAMLGQALAEAGDDRLFGIAAQIADRRGDTGEATDIGDSRAQLRASIDFYVQELDERGGEPPARSREAYFLRLLNLVEVTLVVLESGSSADFGHLANLVDDQIETMVTLDGDDDPVVTTRTSIARVLAGDTDPQHNVFAIDAREAAKRPASPRHSQTAE